MSKRYNELMHGESKRNASKQLTRRQILSTTVGIAAAGTLGHLAGSATYAQSQTKQETKKMSKKGRINQSVCKWCYGKVPLDEFCAYSAKIGLKGVDLVDPKDWPTLKKHGLICTMVSSHPITKGLNNPKHQPMCIERITKAIELTAAEGWPNVICFSGDRNQGIDDEQGLKICAEALKKVITLAEKKKVTLCMELLNSKDHKHYMCDHSAWGVQLVEMVGSERFRLLYDIYHMQRMEGDVINTIREHHKYFAHYHTAGNPGRNELDDQQELNYPPIMKAIAATGFTGYVGQEFVPRRKWDQSLAQAVALCDV